MRRAIHRRAAQTPHKRYERLEARRLFAALAWDGGAGTDSWGDAANWSGDRVPGPTDDVSIDVTSLPSGVHVRSGSQSCSNLTSTTPIVIDGGVLTIGGTATTTGNLTVSAGQLTTSAASSTFSAKRLSWSGGTIGGVGSFRLEVAGVGTVIGTDAKYLVGRFENAGRLTYSGSGLLFGAASGSRAGILDNSGTFRLEGTGQIAAASSALPNQILNSGTLENAALAAATIGVMFVNTGVLDMGTRDLELGAGGSSTTPLNVPAGTTLTLSRFALTAPLTAAGDVRFVSGITTLPSGSVFDGSVTVTQTLILNHDVVLRRVILPTGGIVQGTGNISITESFDWTGGHLLGTGRLVLEANATTRLSGGQLSVSRPVVNHGSLLWTASSNGSVTLGTGGSFFNGGAIDFTLGQGAAGFTGSSDASIFTNVGSLTHRGVGVLTVAASWVNRGTIQVAAGAELRTSGRPGSNSGTITLASGATLRLGSSTTFVDGSSITGAGGVVLAAGTMTLDAATYDVSGITEFAGATVEVRRPLQRVAPSLKGTVTFHAAPTLVNPTLTGTVRFVAVPQVTGTLTVQSGSATFDTGASTLALGALVLGPEGTAKFGGSVPATVGALTVRGILDTSLAGVDVSGALDVATATVTGTSPLKVMSGVAWSLDAAADDSPVAPLTLSGVIHNEGVLTLGANATVMLAGGTFVNQGTLDVTLPQGSTSTVRRPSQATNGSLINTGAVSVKGAGTLSLEAPFINQGLVDLAGGTLALYRFDNADGGAVVVAAGARLRFAGSATLAANARISGAGDVEFSAGTITADGDQLATTGRLLFAGDDAIVRLDFPVITGEATIRGTLTFGDAFTSTRALRTAGNVTFGAGVTFAGDVEFAARRDASGAFVLPKVTFATQQTIAVPTFALSAVLVGPVEIVSTTAASLGIGEIGRDATLRIASTAVCTIYSPTLAGTLVNEGTLVPSQGGASYRSGFITMAGGTLINRNRVLLDAVHDRLDAALDPDRGGGSRVINDGTIRVVGESASLTLAGAVTNNASIYVGGRDARAKVVGTLYQNADIEAGDAQGRGGFGIEGAGVFAIGSRMFGTGGFGFHAGDYVLTRAFFQADNVSVGNGVFSGPVSAANVRVTFPLTLAAGTAVLSNGHLTLDAGAVIGGSSLIRGTISSLNAPITFTSDAVVDVGTATVNGDVLVAGTLALVDRARFVVNGNLTLIGQGVPTIKLQTSLQSSTSTRLTVNGTASLSPPGAGRSRLEVQSIGMLTPGAFYNVMSARAFVGVFDQFAGRSSGDALVIRMNGATTLQAGRPAVTPPVPMCWSSTYEDVERQAITLVFNQDLRMALVVRDYGLVNLTTGVSVSLDPSQLSFSADGTVATLSLTNRLADGRYRLRVAGADVTNGFGTPLMRDLTVNFNVLAGDVNGDAVVSFDDLLTLARNYGSGGGRTRVQGNVNFSSDGLVDFDDLILLARNYGRSLAALTTIAFRPNDDIVSERKRTARQSGDAAIALTT